MALDTSHAIVFAGAMVGTGVGAVGAAIGDGLAGAQLIAGIARQPEAQSRLLTWTFLTVGLAEAVYFINLALMFVFISLAGK
ncbi:MAG TPA: ATP synthase F0 subunit C [Candidatus Micrarchaeaceae archaeon]|nr:ATP synthase F0 subunit C [Candidatus Micrarchaeaceae archaeon]